MAKFNFTVIVSKIIPVEIDYVEGQTNDEILDNCINEARKTLTLKDWKFEVVVATSDWIKNKLRQIDK